MRMENKGISNNCLTEKIPLNLGSVVDIFFFSSWDGKGWWEMSGKPTTPFGDGVLFGGSKCRFVRGGDGRPGPLSCILGF